MSFKLLFAIALISLFFNMSIFAQNNCLHFDGVDDYVNVGNVTALNGTPTLTIEMWINIQTWSTWNTFFSKFYTLNDLVYDRIEFQEWESTGDLGVIIGTQSGGNSYAYTNTHPVYTGDWFHLAMVYDGTAATNSDRLKLYINGQQINLNFNLTIPPLTPVSDAPVLLGAESERPYDLHSFIGKMDEVRIWQTARTQTEIQHNMLTSLVGNESGLLMYYNFNEGIAGGNNAGLTSLIDATSNHYNGTLLNFDLTGNTSNWVAHTITTPGFQSHDIIIGSVSPTEWNVNWSNGSGSERAVFVKQSDYLDSPSPVDNTTYSANSIFGSGSQIGSSGWYCVYNGFGNSVDVSGLTQDSSYDIMACDYNGIAGSELYISSGSSGNPYIPARLTTPPEILYPADNAPAINPSSEDLYWNPVVNATSYHVQVSVNSNFSSLIIDDNTITGFTRAMSELSGSTEYYWRVYAVNLIGESPASETWSFYTTDKKWSFQSSGTTNDLYGVFFTDASHGTVVGTYGTILHTTNGGTDWIAQISGTVNELFGVFFTDASNGTVVGSGGTILHTTNGGTDWVPQTNGVSPDNDFWGVSFADANNGMVTSASKGVILHTTNGGADWITQTTGAPGALYHIAYTDVNNGTVVGAYGTILHTTNAGIDWISQLDPSPAPMFGVSFTDANNGIVVGGDFEYMYGFIIGTTDGGSTWGLQSYGAFNILMDVSFCDQNHGMAVGFGGSIASTTDGGTTWSQSSSGTSTDLVGVSFTDPNNGTAVGMGGTIIRLIPEGLLPVELTSLTSVSNGRTIQLNWGTKTEKNSNKFNVERKSNSADWQTVGSVKASVLSNSPKKYSFTDSKLQSGKYQYRLKMIDNDGTFNYSNLIESEVALPMTFEMSQNYPNPFNPSTKINYTLPFDSKVTLEVYNITGNKIAQLVNNDQAAGYYTVDFNSSVINRNISSGVYFYRIIAFNKVDGTNFTSIKKMILIK
ncbi:MAG: YCF48-related protein [Ignavibacteriaceae bacterium]|nr:YCF48-related protein [Ignavibacteriaceae bacterium]